jgi:apolipoprotein D and lipocalin family protein
MVLGRKVAAFMLTGLLGFASGAKAQKATAVTQFDLNRLRGTWYEIARLPNKPEKRCVSDAFELIAFGDAKNSVQLGDSCVMKHGDSDLRGTNAKQDKHGAGKLKIRHLIIFSRPYWVLDIAPDNSWALIGTPNHKNLWIYSKKATVDDGLLTELKAKASAQGFSMEKLITVPQPLQTSLASTSGAQ